jgi:hypothetical protein
MMGMAVRPTVLPAIKTRQCRTRSGRPKTPYQDRERAAQALNTFRRRMPKHEAERLEAYECEACHYWHLGNTKAV